MVTAYGQTPVNTTPKTDPNEFKSWMQASGTAPTYNAPTTSPVVQNQQPAAAPSSSGSGGGTTYVKNPTVDAMPIDQQLAYYKANPNEGLQEIGRAKGVWNGTTDQAARDSASAWATQLRGQLGITDDDPTYGRVAPSTGVAPAVDQVPAEMYPKADLGKTGIVVDKNAELMTGLLQKFLETTQGTLNRESTMAQNLRAEADRQAKSIFDAKTSQYTTLLNSLTTGQKNDLDSVAGGVENAKMDIEDKSFQDWLAVRQDASNRGLGSSGMANDANTRLLLAKQRDLAGMFTQKQGAVNDINKRYGDQINTARADIANTNTPQISADLFNKMFNDASGKMGEQAKLFAELLKEQMGYGQLNPKDVLADERSGSNNTADNLTKLMVERLPYLAQKLDNVADNTTKLKIAEALNKVNWDIANLDNNMKWEIGKMTNEFNYDRLGAEVLNWAEQNRLKGSEITATNQRLTQQLNYDNAMIDKASNAAQNDQSRLQMDGYKTVLGDIAAKINARIAKDGSIKDNDPDVQAYNRVKDEMLNVMQGVSQVGPPTSPK